jgi:hypothetical protein
MKDQDKAKNPNKAITTQAMLSLLAFVLLLGAAAKAVQPRVEADAALDPTVASAAVVQEPQQPQPNPVMQATNPEEKPGKVAVFTGTIVKNGSDFVLRDESGKVYRLDAPSRAKPYEGRPVKITGKLEENARLIHMDSIEPVKG